MPPSILPEVQSASLGYYTEQIRSEITATVLALKHKLENKRYAEGYAPTAPTSPVHAEYVRLGYLINSHHGEDIFGGDQTLCGLRVEIDLHCPRLIAVGVREVEFKREEEVRKQEYGETVYYTETHYENKDLVEQTTW